MGVELQKLKPVAVYPDAKAVHVTAAAVSGSYFLLRGLAVQLRARWPHAAPARYLSYALGTLLSLMGRREQAGREA